MVSQIKLSTIARVVFTILLLALVYSKIDFFGLIDRLALVGWFDFLLCCLLYLIGQMLSCFKWKRILSEVSVYPRLTEILKSFFLGMFINSFGLGTVGGDVARVLSLPCDKGRRTSVFASVVADRLHGLTVLLTIGVFALLILRPVYVTSYTLMVAFASALILITGWFIGPLAFLRFLPSWAPKREQIAESLRVFPRGKKALFQITLISMLFHFTQISLAYFIFKIILQPLDFSTILVSIPFVNVASALPLSINGIGVRESVSMYLLGPAGISSESTVAFATLWVLIITVISGIAGLVTVPKMGEGIGSFLTRIKIKENDGKFDK